MLSNLNEIVSEERRIRLKRWSRVIEVMLIFGVLYGAGAVTGYWLRDNQANDEIVAMKKEHAEELERTNGAFAQSLKGMTTALDFATARVAQTAATVDSIAQTSESAANAAQKAANTAQKAAAQSKTALDKAGQVPEPTRDQINRSVQRANRAVSP